MISLFLSLVILLSLFSVCFLYQFSRHQYRKITNHKIKNIQDDNNINNDKIITTKGFGNVIYNNTNIDEKGKRSLEKRKYQELKKIAKSKSSIQKLVSGGNNISDKGMSTSARTKFW